MIKKIERSIRHAKRRIELIKKSHGDNPGKTHTYHGGWDLGYWEGRLSILEIMRDEIEGENE